jgi:hypothetical protein
MDDSTAEHTHAAPHHDTRHGGKNVRRAHREAGSICGARAHARISRCTRTSGRQEVDDLGEGHQQQPHHDAARLRGGVHTHAQARMHSRTGSDVRRAIVDTHTHTGAHTCTYTCTHAHSRTHILHRHSHTHDDDVMYHKGHLCLRPRGGVDGASRQGGLGGERAEQGPDRVAHAQRYQLPGGVDLVAANELHAGKNRLGGGCIVGDG